MTVALLVVVAYLLYSRSGSVQPFRGGATSMMLRSESAVSDVMSAPSAGGFGMAKMIAPPGIVPDPIAPSEGKDRLVIQDTNISLVVKKVADAVDAIGDTAKKMGGYLVNSSLSSPEGAASGSITVRVPSDKREDALAAFKQLGVKTVSETVQGTDVTDQYEDLDARLDVLRRTKEKFEAILTQASKVPDLLEVQRELVNLQSQIDSVVGQQKYLTQSAKLTKITIYLSTDEFALPYTPDQPWRPEVIFKEAVRSLVGTFRSAGSWVIWGVVYAPLWIPILGIVWFIKKKRNVTY